MRDPDLMLSLLEEIANEPSGRIWVNLRHYGSDAGRISHHFDLLVDAGHAAWVDRSNLRITNDGYDFLNAIRQDKKYREMFTELFNRGVNYLNAANQVVEFVSKVSPT